MEDMQKGSTQSSKAAEMLRTHDLRATAQRIAIIDVLLSARGPMTAEDIGSALKETFNPTTIYRTLDALEKAGLVKRVNLRTTSAHFELMLQHHHHIVCTSCKTVEETMYCHTPMSREVLKRSKKFKTINDHAVEFFGTCRSCAREK